jgi:hypothetical protein
MMFMHPARFHISTQYHTCLCCNQFLEVAHSVVLITLYADLLAQTVIQNYLDHDCCCVLMLLLSRCMIADAAVQQVAVAVAAAAIAA